MRGFLASQDTFSCEELYTDLQVCVSGAGFYIGTMYNTPDHQEPGSRESAQYYPTREAAKAALDAESWTQRLHA